jgi:hypothetical protein
MFGVTPSSNIMVITEQDASIVPTFQGGQSNSYTRLSNIQKVKRIYYILFGTEDGSKVTDA